MATTIGDALGIDYRGAEANISHAARAGFSTKALGVSVPIQSPIIRPPTPSISTMISKANSGTPGDNIDVFA